MLNAAVPGTLKRHAVLTAEKMLTAAIAFGRINHRFHAKSNDLAQEDERGVLGYNRSAERNGARAAGGSL